MSKKNLSRSALEGGRVNRNKWDRYASHTKERAIVREYCGRAQIDEEYFDSHQIEKRPKVNKEFDDKLGPMYRWLRAAVGQRWDEVRSKAFKLYDTRTTAGRHILYGHLLSSVNETGSEPIGLYKYYDFYVDGDGILALSGDNRFTGRSWRRTQYPKPLLPEKDLMAWVGRRKVIDYGAVQYWTGVPTRYSWGQCDCGHGNCYYEHKTVIEVIKEYVPVIAPIGTPRTLVLKKRNVRHHYAPKDPSYRQGAKFTKEETAYWNNFTPRQKETVTWSKSEPNKSMRRSGRKHKKLR